MRDAGYFLKKIIQSEYPITTINQAFSYPGFGLQYKNYNERVHHYNAVPGHAFDFRFRPKSKAKTDRDGF